MRHNAKCPVLSLCTKRLSLALIHVVPRNEMSAFFKSLDRYPKGFKSNYSPSKIISNDFTHALDIVNTYLSEIANEYAFFGFETLKTVEFSTEKD